MPADSVHTTVTSPPYYGLRRYEDQGDGQLGHEATPELYVAHLADILDEVRRVTRDTLWLNLGDSMAGSSGPGGVKEKDLVGIPWLVAFELRRRGWWLRADIIWSKRNAMPDGATDRPGRTHEYVFLLASRKKYFYDAMAIEEPSLTSSSRTRAKRSVWSTVVSRFKGAHFATFPPELVEPMVKAGASQAGCCPHCLAPLKRGVERIGMTAYQEMKEHHQLTASDLVAASLEEGKAGTKRSVGGTRNAKGQTHKDLGQAGKRTVGWEPSCRHPEALMPIPCTVLDPFAGAATTGLVALHHGRNFIGLELSPTYAELATQRLVETGYDHAPDGGPHI